jgi:hypothetical protein
MAKRKVGNSLHPTSCGPNYLPVCSRFRRTDLLQAVHSRRVCSFVKRYNYAHAYEDASASGQFNLIHGIGPLEEELIRGECRTSDEYALISLQLNPVMGKVLDVLRHALGFIFFFLKFSFIFLLYINIYIIYFLLSVLQFSYRFLW